MWCCMSDSSATRPSGQRLAPAGNWKKSWITIDHILFDWQVFQWLELPSELERLETNQALLLTNRVIFLDTIVNNTSLEDTEYHEVRSGTSLTFWPLIIVTFSWSPLPLTPTRRSSPRRPGRVWTSWARSSASTGTTPRPPSSLWPSWPPSVSGHYHHHQRVIMTRAPTHNEVSWPVT